MKQRISDRWLYFPIISMGPYLIFRLINQSKLIFTFPLDITNDLSTYMAQLFFLAECGFHKLCPYWYNGFINFQFNQPGWYFFTLPIYWLTKSITASTYISLILILIICFLAIYYFGKLHRFSILSRIAFFLFFIANAVSIGNFIKLGRIHELFAWVNFVILAFSILWYKNNKINKKFLLLIPILSIIILSHQIVTLFAFLMLFSLFLVKDFREKGAIIFVWLVSLTLTSFWWIPYVRDFNKTYAVNITKSGLLLIFDKAHLLDNFLSFLIPLILLIVFYFYWESHYKAKKEFIFFLPILITGGLLFFRIIAFLPILKHTYIDPYVTFFTFMILFMFFKLDFKIIPKIIKKAIYISLILLSISSILVSHYYTPYFVPHTALEEDTISLFPYVEDNFLIYKSPSYTSYDKAYYSYAPIYYNLSTPSGWYYEVKEEEYLKALFKMDGYIDDKDCSKILSLMNYLNSTSIITYKEYCDFFDGCGLYRKIKKGPACLLVKR